MHWKPAALSLLVLALPLEADGVTVNFRATRTNGAWTCAASAKPDDASGLTIQMLIDAAPADRSQVVLQATYDNAGAAATAPVPYSETHKLWALALPKVKPADGSALTVSGTIAGAAVTCTAKIPAAAAAQPKEKKPEEGRTARARYTELDFEASAWLASSPGRAAVAAVVERIQAEHRSLDDEDVVLLKHLPSGAPAFPFPPSVSEHQTIQIVAVINKRDLGSVDVNLTTCTRPQRERLKGDFGALAAKPQTAVEPAPDFALMPIGSLIQCGPDTMAYTVTVTPDGSTAAPDPASARLDVRPVYHLAATAFFGFDRVEKATFAARSGVVTQQTDEIGANLLVGATWYPFGVDYGRMRWYNYFLNPFVAVDLDSPKESFVVGTTITVTGGISLAVGCAFHRLDELDGFAPGDPFTGDGTVPTRKAWSKQGRGLYVGVALDQHIFTALKKIAGAAAGGK